MTTKEGASKWTYLDDKTARSSKLYGVNGWAIALIIIIIAPIILLAFSGVNQFINPPVFRGSMINISDIILPGYKNYQFINDIQSIGFQFLHIVAVYLLLKHSPKFQMFYAAIVIIGLISDVAMLPWMFAMEETSKDSAIRIIGILVALYSLYLLSLAYVFKSRRINLTTKKRIQNKYRHLVELDKT